MPHTGIRTCSPAPLEAGLASMLSVSSGGSGSKMRRAARASGSARLMHAAAHGSRIRQGNARRPWSKSLCAKQTASQPSPPATPAHAHNTLFSRPPAPSMRRPRPRCGVWLHHLVRLRPPGRAAVRPTPLRPPGRAAMRPVVSRSSVRENPRPCASLEPPGSVVGPASALYRKLNLVQL